MNTGSELEFVNRGEELKFLEECLRQPVPLPPILVVRSPAGFGKSRLTDELAGRERIGGLYFSVVDPSIRAKAGVSQLYEGFFLQRCAEALTVSAEAGTGPWPSFLSFLRSRRWQTASEFEVADIAKDMPGAAQAYRLGFDYVSRLLAFGRFSPKQLLSSDRADAVQICTEYVLQVLRDFAIVLVIRETQHCDIDSLRTLLRLADSGTSPYLIFEYTTETGEFSSDHQKLFLQAAEARHSLVILDLVRLNPAHLEYLIQHNVESDFSLTSNFYLAWSGNLRSIVELKFRVGIGRRVTNSAEIAGILQNLHGTLEEHIRQLTALERLVLAVVSAHVEAIDHWTLKRVIGIIEQRAAPITVDQAVANLIDAHRFLSSENGRCRIHNDSVSTALTATSTLRPLIFLAEKALRDYYAKVVDRTFIDDVGLSTAVRQLFRLCAVTKDVVGLLRAKDLLSSEVERAQDQATYVDLIASAVESDPELYRSDRNDLVVWAASLAYDISDWGRCVRLLDLSSERDAFSLAMRACCYQEIGRHDEAIGIASELENRSIGNDNDLASRLVVAIVMGCRGDRDEARARLNELVGDPRHSNSPLLGYAYRFFEITEGFNECLEKLMLSLAWFERFSLPKSKAYSQLPAAMMMARLGDVAGAKRTMQEAELTLANQVRDQYMLLNNNSAIEMLEQEPDYALCVVQLTGALRLARDDYTELSILTNLALAYWGLDELALAIDCVERITRILHRHDFADKDAYWAVCFNCAQILQAAGDVRRRDEMLQFPRVHGRPLAVNKSYWGFRYGEIETVEPGYEFLSLLPRHPLYLSHWTIDLDGLSSLKREPLR